MRCATGPGLRVRAKLGMSAMGMIGGAEVAYLEVDEVRTRTEASLA